MSSRSDTTSRSGSSIPPDDPRRNLIVTRSDDQNLPHIGLVGDTYTIFLTGKDTARRFCLIDMHIPPGGRPPPHRHDFEESFIILEGEIEATFRGVKAVGGAGETVHIPANAPHQFQNKSDRSARLLCICSPAGQEEFFAQVGVPVLQPGRPRRQNSMRPLRRSSKQKLKHSPRSIRQSCCNAPETHQTN
jgi:quercetin dioxygenase-like cupin family protein